MMTIHFKLAADKADQTGRCPIFLMAYYNGQRFKQATGEKCDPKQWDENKQLFRRSFPGYQEANTSLEKLEERCRHAYRSYIDQGIIPSATLLKNEIAACRVTLPSHQTYPLITFFEQYVQKLETSDKKYNTVRAYKTTLYRLRQYDPVSRKLFVDGYTQQTHEHLMDYCRAEANLQPNSIFSRVIASNYKLAQEGFQVGIVTGCFFAFSIYTQLRRITFQDSQGQFTNRS